MIAKLQRNLETLREENEQKEPMSRDEQLRDQRRKSIEKTRAAKVAKRERWKSRPVSIRLPIRSTTANFSASVQ